MFLTKNARKPFFPSPSPQVFTQCCWLPSIKRTVAENVPLTSVCVCVSMLPNECNLAERHALAAGISTLCACASYIMFYLKLARELVNWLNCVSRGQCMRHENHENK